MNPRLYVLRLVGSLLAILAVGQEMDVSVAQAQDTPLVYVRCARTSGTFDLTGDIVTGGVTRSVTRTLRGLDIYDVLPDVTNFYSGFSAPCDLMFREADGEERVLFDCSDSSTREAACTAMDPAVSFDGRTVAFSVFRGTMGTRSRNIHPLVLDPSAENTAQMRVTLPNEYLSATEAQLYLVDVQTGALTELPHVEGTFDSGPAFLPNGRLAFTSTRDGNRTTLVWATNASGTGTRIWTMDLDGRNIDLASHHSLSMEEHPYMLRDGRLLFSSWQIFGGLPFRHTNGSIGGFTTLGNLFHLFTQAPDGAGLFAFYGQHSGDHFPSSFGASHIAAHFVTQTGDQRVWFADYYRGNNNGLGIVVGVMPEPDGHEGVGPEEAEHRADVFVTRDSINLAPWASNGDQMAGAMPEPALMHPNYSDPLPFRGKLGHPAALPDNGLMVAWGKGACSTVSSSRIFASLGLTAPPHTSGSGQGTAVNVITSLGLDTPGCDIGLYRATEIPLEHPSALSVIVDSREWHEIQGRAVVPYEVIHGVTQPMIIGAADTLTPHGDLEVGTPFGLLGAASVTDRETHPRGGIHFAGEHQFNSQGTDTINYEDADLCGVRILGVMPNRGSRPHQQIANIAGERVAILGEFPVRHRDGSGAVVMDESGNPDTSFLVRMPANTPYLMQGIDCDGRTLNTDQTWQHLRPGEVKTCGGCHVHSRPSRVTFETTFAATDEYAIPRLGEGRVSLLTGEVDGVATTREVDGYGVQVEFERDIMPIFERRCNSCHGGDTPMALPVLDRPQAGRVDEDPPSTWHCLVADRGQSCLPEAERWDPGVREGSTSFRRPQLTRYLRAFNALGSPLYWKAAGRRTDGNTDSTFDTSSPREDQDLDFGLAHPTEITPEELGLLSRWIDIGAAGGPMELLDTQRPTLHLAAISDGAVVTELRVGTVDLGSGIDPASLIVCIVDASGECTDISGDAQMHGVTPVMLPTGLEDVDVEVEARVMDMTGNETVVRRTVGWLLRTPPPPPPRPDGGMFDGDGGVGNLDGSVTGRGDGGTGGGMSGECGCRTVGVSGQTTPWWLLFGAIWLLRRRRRVQAS